MTEPDTANVRLSTGVMWMNLVVGLFLAVTALSALLAGPFDDHDGELVAFRVSRAAISLMAVGLVGACVFAIRRLRETRRTGWMVATVVQACLLAAGAWLIVVVLTIGPEPHGGMMLLPALVPLVVLEGVALLMLLMESKNTWR